VKPFTSLGEELAIGVVTDIGEAPMNREVGNQRKPDRPGKADCLDEASGLPEGDVFGATATIKPSMTAPLPRGDAQTR
jgi:hypothetical protein